AKAVSSAAAVALPRLARMMLTWLLLGGSPANPSPIRPSISAMPTSGALSPGSQARPWASGAVDRLHLRRVRGCRGIITEGPRPPGNALVAEAAWWGYRLGFA